MTSQIQGPPFIPREFPSRPSDSERVKKTQEGHAATKAKCISTIDLDGAQDIILLQRPLVLIHHKAAQDHKLED